MNASHSYTYKQPGSTTSHRSTQRDRRAIIFVRLDYHFWQIEPVYQHSQFCQIHSFCLTHHISEFGRLSRWINPRKNQPVLRKRICDFGSAETHTEPSYFRSLDSLGFQCFHTQASHNTRPRHDTSVSRSKRGRSSHPSRTTVGLPHQPRSAFHLVNFIS